MINKESILKRVNKIDDKLLVSKAIDRATKSDNAGVMVHTDFYDPYQRNTIEKAFSNISGINYTFNGGYGGAERMIAVFCPNYMPVEDLQDSDFPLKLVGIYPKSREILNHRDYLGSLMGLGIKREKIGDILVKDDVCTVIVLEEIADYIRYNLSKVGNTRVDVLVRDLEAIQADSQKVREIRSTVASLRLDSVASAGYGISRSKIAEYIKGEKVNLNWETCSNAAKPVNEGDTLSIRGKGRVVLEKIIGTTKKDRISILLKKFV